MSTKSDGSVISEMESRLKDFYRSGEPETTSNFRFTDVNLCMEVREVENKGKGVFLLEPVVPGQLLLISNAYVSCSCDRAYAPYSTESYTHAPYATSSPASPRIPEKVCEHLMDKFEKRTSVTRAMEEFLPSIPGDDGEIRASGTNVGRKPLGMVIQSGDRMVLRTLVESMAMCDKVRSLSQTPPAQVEICALWGIWRGLPSFINHSCIPNCHRMRIGTAVILRAATELAAGDELTLPYFDIFEPLAIREMAAKSWNFRCECPRCTFEHSVGEPYVLIQEKVINLKGQLDKAWNKKLGPLVANRLIEKLTNLFSDLNELTHKATGSCKEAEVSTRVKCKEEYWIRGSFIDLYIALYTQFQTSSDCSEGSLPVGPYGKDRDIYLTPKAKHIQNVIFPVRTILEIIEKIHPGNMLGQEFFSILLKNLKQLVECDFKKNLKSNRGLLDDCDGQARWFYSTYYGRPGKEVLQELMLTES